MTSFEQLFANLQQLRQSEDDAYRLKHKKINELGDRLYNLFNDKSARYIVPPFMRKGKEALHKVQTDLIDLSRQITVSMVRNEYGADELGTLLGITQQAVTSPVGNHLNEALDPRMAGVAGVLLYSLNVAFEDAQKAEGPIRDNKEREMKHLEGEVFSAYLKEDAQAATVMKHLASGLQLRGPAADELTAELGMLVTDGYMRSLQVQLDEILQSNCVTQNMSVRKYNISEEKDGEKFVPCYQLVGQCYAMTRDYFQASETNPAQKPAPKNLWFGD